MRALVAITALLLSVGTTNNAGRVVDTGPSGTVSSNIDLNGNKLYVKGTAGTNGFITYVTAGASHDFTIALPPSGDATDPRIQICIASVLTGSDNDCQGGMSFGANGDSVFDGSSNNYHNLNTYATTTGLAIGGGVTSARQDAFQFYNDARFSGDTAEFTASANEQNFMHLLGTVNQSSSASYQMLLIEAHETSTGSGTHRLISAGINSGTSGSMIGGNVANGTDAGGYTPKFVVDSAGKVGFLTGAPTDTITLANTGTWSQYNTTDQTTNYERVKGFWTSNIYVIQSQAGGGGTSRALEMVTNDGSGLFMQDGGVNQFKGSTAGYTAIQADTDGHALTIDGKLTSSSSQYAVRMRNATSGTGMNASNGTQGLAQIIGTINQSSSASYEGLNISITEGSTGSGTKLPLNIQVGGATKMSVDNTGLITTTNANPTVGTMTATTVGAHSCAWHRYDWTNAMVAALGGVGAGDITVATLPAKSVVRNAYVVIVTPDTSTNALTVAVGRTSAAFIDYIVASDAKATANTVYGDASGERGTNLVSYDLPSFTGTTAVKAHFIKTSTNLSTVTGSTGTVYLETCVIP